MDNMLNVGFMHFLLEAEQEYVEMLEQKRRRRRPTTCWVRNWLKPERRIVAGHYYQLMEELRLDDQESFYNVLRITPPMFDELLERITPFIETEDANYREALEPGMKLAITLSHLATGDSYATLKYEFRVARNTICLLVKDVWYLGDGGTFEEVAEVFLVRLNVPHGCKALDGKHVAIRKHPKSGTREGLQLRGDLHGLQRGVGILGVVLAVFTWPVFLDTLLFWGMLIEDGRNCLWLEVLMCTGCSVERGLATTRWVFIAVGPGRDFKYVPHALETWWGLGEKDENCLGTRWSS